MCDTRLELTNNIYVNTIYIQNITNIFFMSARSAQIKLFFITITNSTSGHKYFFFFYSIEQGAKIFE